MTKILSGRELVGFIKERQAKIVKGMKIKPKLVIIRDSNNPVILKYVELKKKYGKDIGVEVEEMDFGGLKKEEMKKKIKEIGENKKVSGVIVQLPLIKREWEEEILAEINPAQDVDGLNKGDFFSATATAIDWLLAGYNIDLKGRKIALVGKGRLVGAPLLEMWEMRGLDIAVFRRGSDLSKLKNYDIIISATGVPGLIKAEMITKGAVVIDAGTASEKGVIVGDIEKKLRERTDLKAITPLVGGVGPLTVAVLFEWVIEASRRS